MSDVLVTNVNDLTDDAEISDSLKDLLRRAFDNRPMKIARNPWLNSDLLMAHKGNVFIVVGSNPQNDIHSELFLQPEDLELLEADFDSFCHRIAFPVIENLDQVTEELRVVK